MSTAPKKQQPAPPSAPTRRAGEKHYPLSRLLTTYSPARALIYRLVIAEPGVQWSVKSLHAALPTAADVSVDAVRSNVYLLLADRLVEPVGGHTVLTVRLTEQGGLLLPTVLTRWRQAGGRARS